MLRDPDPDTIHASCFCRKSERGKYNLAYRKNKVRDIKKIRKTKFDRLASKHWRKKCSCFNHKLLILCQFVQTKLSQHRIL